MVVRLKCTEIRVYIATIAEDHLAVPLWIFQKAF